jgi:hypothetical protein
VTTARRLAKQPSPRRNRTILLIPADNSGQAPATSDTTGLAKWLLGLQRPHFGTPCRLVAVDDDAVAAGRLGGVQGAVGAGDQFLGDLSPIPAGKAGGEGLGVGVAGRSNTSAACSVVASGRSRLNSSPP